jgi:hypothetical protein
MYIEWTCFSTVSQVMCGNQTWEQSRWLASLREEFVILSKQIKQALGRVDSLLN